MIACSLCGSRRHPTSHCPRTFSGQRARAQLHRTYCGSVKHNRDAVPERMAGSPLARLRD
ncbi:MAG: hypothetical protein ACR2GT_04935 [Gaiellaceae bacterium]